MRLRRSYAFAGLAIIGFALLLVYAFVQLLMMHRTLVNYTGENMLWNVTQAEREARKLAEIILLLPETSAQDALSLQLDLLLSRMQILNDNPQYNYYVALGGENHLLEVNQIINKVKDNISDLSISNYQSLLPSFAQFGRLSNKVMLTQRELEGAQRDRKLQTIYLIMTAIAGLLAAGSFISWQLLTKLRALDTANAALNEHRQKLEHTIDERTAALRTSLENERFANDIYKNFLTTVSHQFRTPISIIDMIAQRFIRRPEEITRNLLVERSQRIRTAVRRLIIIIDSTINNDKLNESGIHLMLSEVNLSEIIHGACLYHKDIYPERIISINVLDGKYFMNGDKTLLEQIIINFLSNAEKYSPPWCPIDVSLEETDGVFICTVSDHGIGIPEDDKAKIFNRFFRAPNVSHLAGSGLGLNLSLKLAQLHGGDIIFKANIASGTDFQLRLPKHGIDDG